MTMLKQSLVFALISVVTTCSLSPALAQPADPADWKIAAGPLMTRWAKDVSPDNVHNDYPRPQLVRQQWQNLNGLWDYAIRPRDQDRPTEFDGRILVPFAVESALSGVMKKVGRENRLWYQRQFSLTDAPSAGPDGRTLLHFEAVDWHAEVWVNGKKVGEHRGGYAPFTLDITDALDRRQQQQQLLVAVWDPTDRGFQPRGKQVNNPQGIWYTSVTGIWRTVWLEQVPATHIRSLKITPDVDRGEVRVAADLVGAKPGDQLMLAAVDDTGKVFTARVGADQPHAILAINEPRLWSPDSPRLYDLQVSVARQSDTVDRVSSYFGMRKIQVSMDQDGFNRLFLNGQPLFQFGPLDQGWWPDGLYTAPTDEALKYDIEMTKRLGMNMCRKHVKVEPARWYYWCDKLGLLVWQDMPNGDRHIGPNDPDIERSEESAENYRRELTEMIDWLHNHPSIVIWVPFNEGWGQFDTNEILAWVKRYDPTRLVDGPSGWADRGSGDMHDVHHYPGPGMPRPESTRAAVLGEFGGLGWPVENHLWWNRRNWGYRTYTSQQELQRNYENLIRRLRPLIGRGLAAAVYTQTTDVEGEVNGLMTYDRAIVKLDAERIGPLHARLYEPPPIYTTTTLLPTSEKEPRTWKYTFNKPSDQWNQADFDDQQWQSGPGGFGEPSTPGSVVRTSWKSPDIWLRRTFQLEDLQRNQIHLRIHHDEDVEVYINGKQVLTLGGYTTEYSEVEIDPALAAALRPGQNTIAVHCHQTGGGQYIDVGIIDVQEQPRSSGSTKR